MNEVAKVVKVKGKRAFVCIEKTAKCEGCNICSFNRNKQLVVPVQNELGAAVGDNVELIMPDRAPLIASAVLYVIPLAFMFIGVIIGTFINVYAQIGMAFGFLAIGFIPSYFIDKYYAKKRGYSPSMLRIVESASQDIDK